MATSNKSPSPMLARSASAGLESSRFRPNHSLLPFGVQPEVVLNQIRALITDDYLEARRLAAQAAARFPDHEEIQNAKRILSGGKAVVCAEGPESSTDEEFEWLRNAPASARGKWVALLGKELVVSAESLVELMDSLRAKNFQDRALIHRLE